MQPGRGEVGFPAGARPVEEGQAAMTRRYNAFLLRHWSLDADQGQRIEIQHVATGRQTLVSSLAAALTWMQVEIGNDSVATRSPPANDLIDASDVSKFYGTE
jgi:hypothetical protein